MVGRGLSQWRVYRPVVEDSHHFDEEQDTVRIRIRIRIIVEAETGSAFN
jgi:hypothetical protein